MMKNIRPLEMMLLVCALLILIASIFAVGYYGPELINILQRENVIQGDAVSPIKIIISRVSELLTQSIISGLSA
ncbi:MAG: hypothetical protein P8105_02610 [Dehalococcoidia bacterium]